MENETINQGGNQGAQAAPSSASKRSASYPAMTLQDAYTFALKINDKFSDTAEVTRKEIASVLGVHDNTISRQVAAVAAYGFSEKKMNKGESEYKYKLTQLFKDVFMPDSEKQKRVSMISAFGSPKLFGDLIAKYDGSVIPLELPNALIKHHGITKAAAEEVADIFIRSGQQAGVINDNRVLNYKVTLGAVQKTQYAEIIEESPRSEESSNNGIINRNTPTVIEPVNMDSISDRKVPIHLTKNKMAYLVYPSDISANDITIIEYQVKGILLRLQLEREEEAEENKAAVSGS